MRKLSTLLLGLLLVLTLAGTANAEFVWSGQLEFHADFDNPPATLGMDYAADENWVGLKATNTIGSFTLELESRLDAGANFLFNGSLMSPTKNSALRIGAAVYTDYDYYISPVDADDVYSMAGVFGKLAYTAGAFKLDVYANIAELSSANSEFAFVLNPVFTQGAFTVYLPVRYYTDPTSTDTNFDLNVAGAYAFSSKLTVAAEIAYESTTTDTGTTTDNTAISIGAKYQAKDTTFYYGSYTSDPAGTDSLKLGLTSQLSTNVKFNVELTYVDPDMNIEAGLTINF